MTFETAEQGLELKPLECSMAFCRGARIAAPSRSANCLFDIVYFLLSCLSCFVRLCLL